MFEASERARCSSPVLQLGVPALCSSSVFEEAPSAVEVIPPPHIRVGLTTSSKVTLTAVMAGSVDDHRNEKVS